MQRTDKIIEKNLGNIKIVQYNRPHKKNATDLDMYVKVTEILNETAYDETSILVITGAGDFYSSGNDVSAAYSSNGLLDVIKDYIQAFITFPKLLIAVVNGPAIGIAATTLGLCDIVFASESSYFYTPFTKLGFVAEGCSSFTFPRLLGGRKAAEMLLCDYKMYAKEALACGFVNEIYKPKEIQSKVWDKITKISDLPQKPLRTTKKLMKQVFQDELMKANENEIQELKKIWNLKVGTNDLLIDSQKSKL